MKALLVIGLSLLLANTGAAAFEAKAPKIKPATVDWDAARTALGQGEAARRLSASAAASVAPADPFVQLNQATSAAFPTIEKSAVPVLLPFDLDAFLRNKAGEDVNFLKGFGKPKFFLAGPGGYSATFSVPLTSTEKPRNVEISLSGFALLYELDERAGGEEKPLMGLSADFPDIRRFYFETHVRYLFRRFGVLYEVSTECYDGSTRSGRKLSCQDAHSLIAPLLKALAIAGGKPQPIVVPDAKPEETRPRETSAIFSFYPPGRLISGTSARRRGGDPDLSVYADIRFPLADGPAQTYSQMYIDVGDCTTAAGDSKMVRRYGAPFRCAPGSQIKAEDMPRGGQNMYPWRDAFCEMRAFYVGQCPSGFGHQGQDIVPVGCALNPRDGEECDRGHHRVVAVHDGMILRTQKQEGIVVVVNEPGKHLRFRYLHMNPRLLDESSFFSGRPVLRGQIIGKVGNFAGREAGTSYHLHFDMQVPTEDGWVWVNPYATLVSSYEKLIGGRGNEIEDASQPASTDLSETASVPSEYQKAAPRKEVRQNARKKRHAAHVKTKKKRI